MIIYKLFVGNAIEVSLIKFYNTLIRIVFAVCGSENDKM